MIDLGRLRRIYQSKPYLSLALISSFFATMQAVGQTLRAYGIDHLALFGQGNLPQWGGVSGYLLLPLVLLALLGVACGVILPIVELPILYDLLIRRRVEKTANQVWLHGLAALGGSVFWVSLIWLYDRM